MEGVIFKGTQGSLTFNYNPWETVCNLSYLCRKLAILRGGGGVWGMAGRCGYDLERPNMVVNNPGHLLCQGFIIVVTVAGLFSEFV
mgnify:CR=1 FL=1